MSNYTTEEYKKFIEENDVEGKLVFNLEYTGVTEDYICVEHYHYPEENHYFTIGEAYILTKKGLVDSTADTWGNYNSDSQGLTSVFKFTLKSELDTLMDKALTENTTPDAENIPLRNVKIDLRKEDGTVDEELSRAFQEAVFASGGTWHQNNYKPKYLDKPFISVNADGGIGYWVEGDCIHPTYQEITFEYERELIHKAYLKEEASPLDKEKEFIKKNITLLQEQLEASIKQLESM